MTGLKLEAWKRYRTRDGRETDRLQCAIGPVYPFKARVEPYGVLSWTPSGHFAHRTPGHDLDLISEIADEPKEAPMVKMVVRDEKKEPEKVIEWWLEPCGVHGGVDLMASLNGREKFVLTVRHDGSIKRHLSVLLDGLQTDDFGRIKIVD